METFEKGRRLFLAHDLQKDGALLYTVKLCQIDILGHAQNHLSVDDRYDTVVPAEHGFQVSWGVTTDGTVGGEKMGVGVVVVQGYQLFQFGLDVPPDSVPSGSSVGWKACLSARRPRL